MAKETEEKKKLLENVRAVVAIMMEDRAKGRSQKDISRAAGFNGNLVNDFVREKTKDITFTNLVSLINALGYSLAEFSQLLAVCDGLSDPESPAISAQSPEVSEVSRDQFLIEFEAETVGRLPLRLSLGDSLVLRHKLAAVLEQSK